MKIVSAAKFAQAEKQLKPTRAYGMGAQGMFVNRGSSLIFHFTSQSVRSSLILHTKYHGFTITRITNTIIEYDTCTCNSYVPSFQQHLIIIAIFLSPLPKNRLCRTNTRPLASMLTSTKPISCH